MSKRTLPSMLSIFAGIAILVSSCAGPPNEARSAAEQAVQDARTGEAEKYAADAFKATVTAFNSAEKHMTAKEYSEALAGYEETIALATTAGKETGVGRQLSKADAETKLTEFLTNWGEIGKMIEKGRGRKAKALAQEAKVFGDSLAGSLNDLKGAEQWHELLAALESANVAAIEFNEKAAAK
ncbi:MAG: hypothetical protein HOH43_22740 [Candidatus Latescibacteria bacterium]|jgi:hypothetical protein|nr:hypothetical protein [Candidatus Latescibacterota bacterium]